MRMDEDNSVMDSLEEDSQKFIVFMCKLCRLPLADSLDWDGHVREKQGILHFTAVSDNICKHNKPVVSSFPEDEGCYSPGSAKKQVIAHIDAPVTLDKCAEYEEEIKKLKHVMGSLQRKIEYLEKKSSS